jgi:hypothetical protein
MIMTEIRDESVWHHRPRRTQALAAGRSPRTFHGSAGDLNRNKLADSTAAEPGR